MKLYPNFSIVQLSVENKDDNIHEYQRTKIFVYITENHKIFYIGIINF